MPLEAGGGGGGGGLLSTAEAPSRSPHPPIHPPTQCEGPERGRPKQKHKSEIRHELQCVRSASEMSQSPRTPPVLSPMRRIEGTGVLRWCLRCPRTVDVLAAAAEVKRFRAASKPHRMGSGLPYILCFVIRLTCASSALGQRDRTLTTGNIQHGLSLGDHKPPEAVGRLFIYFAPRNLGAVLHSARAAPNSNSTSPCPPGNPPASGEAHVHMAQTALNHCRFPNRVVVPNGQVPFRGCRNDAPGNPHPLLCPNNSNA